MTDGVDGGDLWTARGSLRVWTHPRGPGAQPGAHIHRRNGLTETEESRVDAPTECRKRRRSERESAKRPPFAAAATRVSRWPPSDRP